MLYTNDCPLYGLQSKKMLKHLLRIYDNKFLKQEYIASMISPYIDTKGKPRLIEPPSEELKAIQKRLKRMLGQIVVPNNVFSGIKGRSYVDNAVMHIECNKRNLFKIDITAFFPSISREAVYQFFRKDLLCSPDVAQILSDLTTIDLDKSNARDLSSIYKFLDSKNVTCKNHLISGAPTSQILSYLVNHKMFEEMQKIADNNNATMSIYVDDVTFSSEHRISHMFKRKIVAIVGKYGYQISKAKGYTKLYPKLVTGVIINAEGKAVIKNSLREKIIREHRKLKDNPEDTKCRQRLIGLLTAARQVTPQAFSSIYSFVYESSLK